MRKIIYLLFIFIIFTHIFSYGEDKTTATLFYSPHCKVCIKLKEEFLPSIKNKYQDKLEWKELDTSNDPNNLSLLFSIAGQFKRKSAVVPAILVGDTFMIGKREIEENLEKAIEQSLIRKVTPFNFLKRDLLDVFKRISLFTVIGSGLIDGINPCAFAVIIFFVSFLAVYGYRKREIVYVGLFYCLAVFITYLMLGLGFFKFLYSLKEFYLLIKLFYYFVSFFCFLLAIIALYDYFKFKKTKDSEDLILQLPKFLKKRINIVIGSHLREKKEENLMGLALSSFTVGFMVSLLEAVCTGQVYLPTIVFILKNTNLRLKALSYLFLYNLMFILPLIIVFLLSLLGLSSQKFNQFLKKNLGKIKILMALLFFTLGILILWLS